MNESDPLDDLLARLRGAATPAELEQESSIVDAMASSLTTTKGFSMFNSRRARIGSLVAAGVIGFGGMAAASSPGGPLNFGDRGPALVQDATEVTTTTTTEVTTTTTEATTTTTEATTTTTEVVNDLGSEALDGTEMAVDDPDTEFDEANDCLEGNHGKTVSAAARGDEEYEEQLGEYEQRTVAQSSCGKPPAGSDEVDAVEEVEADDDSDERTDGERPKPEKSSKPDVGGRPDHAGKPDTESKHTGNAPGD